MCRTRCWLLLGAGSLLVALVATALLEPNRILVGLLQGDAFFQWRPTRYWREVLRQDGVQGRISDETIAIFKVRESAVPVLRACALDQDRNVRWPAVLLLGRVGGYTLMPRYLGCGKHSRMRMSKSGFKQPLL
jgi:hypothetical protein